MSLRENRANDLEDDGGGDDQRQQALAHLWKFLRGQQCKSQRDSGLRKQAPTDVFLH